MTEDGIKRAKNFRTKLGPKVGPKIIATGPKVGPKIIAPGPKMIYGRTKSICGRTEDGPKIKIIRNTTKSTLVQLWSVSCPSLVHLWSVSGLTLVQPRFFLVQPLGFHCFFSG